MAAVTLIGTVHNERGACTVDALHKILRTLGPTVAFLEIRASDLAIYATQMLEARAVQSYSMHGQVEAIAMDDFQFPTSFRSEMDFTFAYVEQRSEEYNELVEKRESTASLGFEALNGADFEALVEKCENCMEACIAGSNDKEFIRRYAAWTTFLRQREESMLSNIYDFCRKQPDTRGVFLVGAAHLSSLTKGVLKRIAKEPEAVSWEVWNNPNRLSLR